MRGRILSTIMDCSGVAPLPWLVLTLLSTVSAALYRIRPESTEVLVNQTVTLYCAFNGLAPSDVVNWYWYNPETDDKLYHISARGRVASEFSRHSIVGSSRRGEYNLRIRDVQPADEGNYRCSVFTVRDAGDARLTVVVPPTKSPTITGHKGPYVVGEELQLVCRTNGGKPLPTLMWYNGTEPLDPFGTYYQDAPLDDIVQTELRIPSLTKWEDSMNISCLADQGVQGVASQKITSIQLQVYYSPTITVPINSLQALEGTYANLTCLWEGNPPPLVSWTRDGDSLPQNAEISNSSLLIPRVSRSDSGAYLCEADNGIQPRVTGEINMEVIFPPRIKSTFDGEISVLYGQNVFKVDCLAEGNPKPNVTWRRKDTNQPYNNPLTLSPLNYQTEGIYVCVARTKRFPEVTREAFINVIGRPEVVTEASSVSAAGGDTVELTCTIASDPVPEEIVWTLAGEDGKKTTYRTGRTGDVFVKKTKIVEDKIQSVLLINSAESAHTGDYVCIASNMFGQDRQEFRVYVTDDSSDVVVIAAVTMGVVLGVLFAVMATLCLRARNIWTCRLSKSPERGTRRSESFSYCAGSEDELAAKSSLNMSSKVPEEELATIELQKLNGISTHRSTSSLNSQPVVISSPFTEIKRVEYSCFTTDRSRFHDEEEEEKYPRHCPYYVGELTNRQETVKLLPSARTKEDDDDGCGDTIGSDPGGPADIQAKSTDHYQPEAGSQTNFV
ncbi:hemicentin-2-like isoform X1 [Branchiostoma floridae]|uniref:Hemicentin-2-like isoform X1 n=1 Tax=Branchiostoma floridae TaxID=7739 RepID=A0A9J7N2T3_BRAFL|nr:hemicentin-2-like isoform X1 [Branchiostoma floridae]